MYLFTHSSIYSPICYLNIEYIPRIGAGGLQVGGTKTLQFFLMCVLFVNGHSPEVFSLNQSFVVFLLKN